MAIGFYALTDLFPDNYTDLIAAIKAIMQRAIDKGATDFIFFDGTHINRVMRGLTPDGITQHYITLRDIVPSNVAVTYLADKAWLHQFADYVVVIQAERPTERDVLWLNSDTLEAQWLL